MHRIVRESRFQLGILRKVSAIVGIGLISVTSCQSYAANDAGGKEACGTVLKPLVIQIGFPGTSRNISTGTVRKKFLDELDEYTREMSHNRVCIKGEVTENWYPLPNPIANYWVPWQNLQVDKSKLRSLVRDSLNAVDEDIDVSKYDFVIIALGATFKEWGNHGLAAYPGLLGWVFDDMLYTKSRRKVNRGIAVYASTVERGHVFHDVAHILGGVKDGKRVLPCLYDQDLASHSTSRDPAAAFKAFTDSQIHMGGWDPMSCNNCLQRPSPPGISSWTRLRLGWMDPAKVRVVNAGEKAQITLGPLADASSETLAINIPVTATTYYLVENRQFMGQDKYLPEEGVLIMYADDKIGESRHGQGAVHLVNANPSVSNLESAAFDIGKNDSFVDDKNGIQIKLVKKNDRSYDVLVERTQH